VQCFIETSLVIIGTDRDRKTGVLRTSLAQANGQSFAYVGAVFIRVRGEAWRAASAVRNYANSCDWSGMKDSEWVEPRVRHPKYLRHAVVKHVEQLT
jgi:hypothetical protein